MFVSFLRVIRACTFITPVEKESEAKDRNSIGRVGGNHFYGSAVSRKVTLDLKSAFRYRFVLGKRPRIAKYPVGKHLTIGTLLGSFDLQLRNRLFSFS